MKSWREILSFDTNNNEFEIVVSNSRKENLIERKATELGIKYKGRVVQINHSIRLLFEGTFSQYNQLINYIKSI